MALATAKRAEIFTSNIDKHCAFCGSIENYAHLFFLCDLPQQVWVNFNTPLSTHLINPDLDGVQHIIPHLFSTNPTEENLTQTLYFFGTFGKLEMIIASKGRAGLLVANMASYAICSEFDFGDS
jgi:hypothetical protein